MIYQKDFIYKAAQDEIRIGKEAIIAGNIGRARVCARRGCGLAIDYWLQNVPGKNWGSSAISMLTQLQKDHTIPQEICEAAERLTRKVNQNFETGVEEDPLKDAELIINYFLNFNHKEK